MSLILQLVLYRDSIRVIEGHLDVTPSLRRISRKPDHSARHAARQAARTWRNSNAALEDPQSGRCLHAATRRSSPGRSRRSTTRPIPRFYVVVLFEEVPRTRSTWAAMLTAASSGSRSTRCPDLPGRSSEWWVRTSTRSSPLGQGPRFLRLEFTITEPPFDLWSCR